MENSVVAGDTLGTVLIVGAGVAGIQATLDLADSGFKVFLIDKGPAIGGKMSQLDKTFPTNDCSMCILSPKFIECATNPNVSIITNTRIDHIDGQAGNFNVTLIQEPRYVDGNKCTGCGTCADYCPVYMQDAYNENLSTYKCIHQSFPQAVPAVSVVDPSHCLYLLREICQICVPACKNKAIDFHQKPRRLELKVGGVILALGYEAFRPQLQSHYGYLRLRNVITSLEFERLLSASGPHGGVLMRPSDKKRPQKIAWIQCVGSRDTVAANTYCSSVCCMYAIKQVLLSKEHNPDLEAMILHNDIRAFGKGFERYYERAKKTPGVRFIWSKASVLGENPETKDVILRYQLQGSQVRDEEFDLVVLSTGLVSPDSNGALAERLSVGTNSHGFCGHDPFSPIETSRPGVFSCGVFNAPMDIPDSVTMASGAASLVSQLLSEQRGECIEEKSYPPERDIRGHTPRVGVFVCDCGTNIAKVVDVAQVVSHAKRIEGVFHAEESTFACSIDAIQRMIQTIKEKGLNRIVVAACTPRTHEPVFRDALRQGGLNPFLVEMANIREHCSWVHMHDKPAATQKARELVEMSVEKAKLLKALPELSYDITRACLVIGGGIAGMVSALALANQGIKVHLVEKDGELGGLGRTIRNTLEGGDIRAYCRSLIHDVYRNLLIQVYTDTDLLDFSGYVGNFSTRVATGKQKVVKSIAHGTTIVATGTEEFKPNDYLYGEDPRVLTLLELEAEITKRAQRLKNCRTAVIIQCVGSRDDERPYCSRVCCSQGIKNALRLKKIDPEMEVYILYRDMRTYGLREDYYRKAAERGVRFIRYEVDDKPNVQFVQEGGQTKLRVMITEPTLGKRLGIDTDILGLAAALVPARGNKALSRLLKVPLNEDGFFMEAHMKLRPVDFATDGVFMCGSAHSPKFIDESIAQAQAAASRAMTILSKEKLSAGGEVCRLHEAFCTGCGVCQEVCPYHAIEVDATKMMARLNVASCKGCGLCVSSCRSGAMDIGGFSDEQILSLLEAS
jgi:heterodisulfide reductase subunit A